MTLARDQIRAYFARWERLQDEQDAIKADLSELFKEAKGQGLNAKALRAAFRIKRHEGVDRHDEAQADLELYLGALGYEGIAPARVENIDEIPPATEQVDGNLQKMQIAQADPVDEPGEINGHDVIHELECRDGEPAGEPLADGVTVQRIAPSEMQLPEATPEGQGQTAATSSIYPDDFPIELRRVQEPAA